MESVINHKRLDEIEKRTRDGGGEIVNLMKTSSYYAAGAAVFRMVQAFALDRQEVLPFAAYLEGEYRVRGLYAGGPVVDGGDRIERVNQIELSAADKKRLERSVRN